MCEPRSRRLPRTATALAGLALGASVLLASCDARRGPPYPSSERIAGIEWDYSSHVRAARGSDNFAVTWAADDSQVVTWGDGWGFERTLPGGKIGLGISRIVGPFDDPEYEDLWGRPTTGPHGKSYAVLSIGGVLYMWYGPGSRATGYKWQRLARSLDLGRTWADADWRIDGSHGLIKPAFAQYGRDYAGAPDDYVYAYFIHRKGDRLMVHRPGRVSLARVPRDRVWEPDAYEWVSGFDAAGAPAWSTDIADNAPVFEDARGGVGWNLSVTYNLGLERYILVTEHGETFRDEKASLGFFEAPYPWGPWRTIAYYDDWAADSGISDVGRTFYGNFSNKWTSGDGRDFVFVFSGTRDMDSYNAVRGRFITVDARGQDGGG